MDRKARFSRWLIGIAILALAECASVAVVDISLVGPAQAQRSDTSYPFAGRQRRSGGFFQQLFGSPSQQQQQLPEQERERAPSDYSRAPPPRKPDSKDQTAAPTTSIVVMGDGMADWLAYGLEDAFSDSPDVAIVRESKARSGLLRYDSKSDLDWWHAARDILSKDKANYVVMMLGVGDRQNIREKDIAKEEEKKDADKTDKAGNADNKADQPSGDGEDASIVAPEPPPSKKTNGVVEFRTDQWEKVYSRRIDETVAALKSKGVPVFWVGLPSIRGTRSTADVVYLNDLFRARAERAGAIYVDVWDGFVDEAGKYASYGPDYEGQMRRLRSGDGVYFTKYGARKLAHYVEREIRRYMNNRDLSALPTAPVAPLPGEGKPTARPLAGPVVPLSMTTGNTDALLGGGSAPSSARTDATATDVLVKGDPVSAPPGRADDFVWPHDGEAARVAPNASASAPPPGTASLVKPVSAAPAQPESTPPKPAEANLEPPAAKSIAEPEPNSKPPHAERKSPKQAEKKPRPQREAPPRPPQPLRPRANGLFGTNGPLGWMR